jgi:hypothetical protein
MESIEAPHAVVVPRQTGDYMAVSAPGEAIRLAVIGVDEPTAREAFATAAGRWLELCAAAKMRDHDG